MGEKTNIVLVGMPSAGKSTVGVLLAKRLSLEFLDTDLAIQRLEGASLQDIINAHGVDALRRIEEGYVVGLDCNHTVIATGGSVIYSEPAMQRLRELGCIVHLDVPLAELERRLTNFDTRGLVRRRDQTLRDLYQERLPLYRAWADVTVECGTLPHEQVCSRVTTALPPALAPRRPGEPDRDDG